MKGHRWRMEQKCVDCPFQKDGPGAILRRSLRAGRMAEIKSALRRDGHFICHKTSPSTGDGSNLVCAGALEWQEARGLSSQYARICERITGLK